MIDHCLPGCRVDNTVRMPRHEQAVWLDWLTCNGRGVQELGQPGLLEARVSLCWHGPAG